MSDFDELIRVYGLDERMFALRRLSRKERDISRTALTDAISAVTSERDILQKREYELLTIISNGKKVKANAIYDFDRYQTAINAGYVDGLLYEHRARLAKDAS